MKSVKRPPVKVGDDLFGDFIEKYGPLIKQSEPEIAAKLDELLRPSWCVVEPGSRIRIRRAQ